MDTVPRHLLQFQGQNVYPDKACIQLRFDRQSTESAAGIFLRPIFAVEIAMFMRKGFPALALICVYTANTLVVITVPSWVTPSQRTTCLICTFTNPSFSLYRVCCGTGSMT